MRVSSSEAGMNIILSISCRVPKRRGQKARGMAAVEGGWGVADDREAEGVKLLQAIRLMRKEHPKRHPQQSWRHLKEAWTAEAAAEAGVRAVAGGDETGDGLADSLILQVNTFPCLKLR